MLGTLEHRARNGAWVGTALPPTNTLAALGGNQAAAAAIVSDITRVTSATGTTADGVRLPVGTPGDTYMIANETAVTVKVYPATGGIITGLSANANTTITANKGASFVCVAANRWVHAG